LLLPFWPDWQKLVTFFDEHFCAVRGNCAVLFVTFGSDFTVKKRCSATEKSNAFDEMNVKRLQCQHFLHALLVPIGVGTPHGDAVWLPTPSRELCWLQASAQATFKLKAKRKLSPVGEGFEQKRSQGDDAL
jgi:hypothetical protein